MRDKEEQPLMDDEEQREGHLETEAELRRKISELEASESKRKEVEEALRRSEENQVLYFEHISDVIYSINSNLVVEGVTPSVERALGYKPEELVGRLIYEIGIVTPESLERAFFDIRRVLAGERIPSAEYEFIAKDGNIRVGEVSGTPIWREGKIGGLVSVARDVTERKRAERALRESEERFRRLAENAGDVIFRFEFLPQTRFAYVSPAGARLTHYALKDFYTNPGLLLELVHPTDRYLWEEATRGVIPPGNLLSLRWVRRDGSIIWTEQHVVPIYDQAGELVAIEVIARDVTERKKAEEALRTAEAKYRALVEGIPMITYTANVDNLRSTLYVSPQIEAMLGFTQEEWMADPELWSKQLHADDREGVLTEYERCRLTGGPFVMEYRLRRRNEEVIWVRDEATILYDAADEPRYLNGASWDITERKSAEEKMRAISTEWRMTFDAISEAICLLDLEENVSRCNRSARNLFGRLFSEIIGRKLGELLPANPEPIARCIVRMRHSRGREVCRLQTSDRWLRAAMDPVLDDTGVLVGAVLILSEITDNSHQSTAQAGPL